MNLLISKILGYQIRRKYIEEREKEIYEYAYMIFGEACINLLVAIMIGCFFGELKLVGCFLCSYIFLRRYSGGYHADKGYICGIVSAVLIILLCVLYKMSIDIYIPRVGYFFFFIIQLSICRLAPVDSKNKRLNESAKQKYRKIAIFFLVLQMAVIFLGISLKIRYMYWGISYSHVVLCFMMFIGTLKNYIGGISNHGE